MSSNPPTDPLTVISVCFEQSFTCNALGCDRLITALGPNRSRLPAMPPAFHAAHLRTVDGVVHAYCPEHAADLDRSTAAPPASDG